MTIWDTNVAELSDALSKRGFRPLDDAHVLTRAVEALEYFDGCVSEEDHTKALTEAEEGQAEAERETVASNRRITDLEEEISDLKSDRTAFRNEIAELEAENAALRKALDGDSTVLVEQNLNTTAELYRMRENVCAILRALRERTRALETTTSAARIQKKLIIPHVWNLSQAIDWALAKFAPATD